MLQALGGVRNRTISEVEVRFDGGDPRIYRLDGSSRPEAVPPGCRSGGPGPRFPERTFSRLEITITGTDPGRPRAATTASAAVGFAEVVVVDDDGTRPVADDVVRLPVDLLGASRARPPPTIPSPWC